MGNYYSKETADDDFYKKKAIVDIFYNKGQYDSNYATASDIDMNNFYDKSVENEKYMHKGILDDYYKKDDYDSKYVPVSFNNEITSNYYDKDQMDSNYLPKNDSQGIDNIKNLLVNYSDKGAIDAQNFPTVDKLNDAFNGIYTAYDITNGFSDHDHMYSLSSTRNAITVPLRNNYYYKYFQGIQTPQEYVADTLSYQYDPDALLGMKSLLPYDADTLINNQVSVIYTDPYLDKQTLYNSQSSFPYQTETTIVSRSFSDNGIVSCFISITDTQKNVDGSIFLYYGEGAYTPILVSGCSVRYVSGSDYALYSNSFSYPVRKGSTIRIAMWGVSINSDAKVNVLIQYQPIVNVSINKLTH